MRIDTVLGLACCWLMGSGAAEAQIVRYGPGGGVSVRAPFVHVEVGPGGSTYVRAPFTSVNTPGFTRTTPRYDYRSGRTTVYRTPSQTSTRFRPLTAEEFARGDAATTQRATTDPAQMSWRELRRHTRSAAGRLDNELRRTADGPAWTASLRPGTIRDLLAEDTDQPPAPNTVNQLLEILQSYDALVESNGYPQIARLSAFREMRQALGELVLPPLGRTRRNLETQSAALHQDLSQFETGAGWQEHLELPPAPHDGQADTEQTLRRFEELLARYQQAEGPAEFRPLAELASYRAARETLAGYVELLKENGRDEEPKPSQPEAIPLPRPLP